MSTEEKRTHTIYIVSGLPRSGTSMMMQLLNNGGLDVLTDHLRKGDENNPKGYMEFEKVKRISTDNSWMYEANGKALKVIAQLIQYLPGTFHYKIIFMLRDIHEILKSQQKMLGKDTGVLPLGLAEIFKKQVVQAQAFISTQLNMDVIYVNYSDIISNPEQQIEAVNSFLGMKLNIPSMIESIDKNLYRNKKQS